MSRPNLHPLLFVLDTETTGFPQNPETRCLQLGVVAIDQKTREEISSLRLLLAPDVWGEDAEQAVKTHGITRQRAEAEGVDQTEGWQLWVNWVKELCARPEYTGGEHKLAAWNAAFDSEIVRRWGQRVAPQSSHFSGWPSWLVAGKYLAVQGCLMKAYEKWMQYHAVKGSKKLTEASQRFGLGAQADIHDALEDARMAAAVWRKMEG